MEPGTVPIKTCLFESIGNRLRGLHKQHALSILTLVVCRSEIGKTGWLKPITLNGAEFLFEKQTSGVLKLFKHGLPSSNLYRDFFLYIEYQSRKVLDGVNRYDQTCSEPD